MASIAVHDKLTREDPHSLVPVDWNTQERTRDELDRIKASIRAHGLVGPIIARPSDRSIAGGHGRLEAVLELIAEGHQLDGGVPVVWKECSDAELMALNMALNNATGQPNFEKVAFAAMQIREFGREDLLENGATGFAPLVIRDIATFSSQPAGTGPSRRDAGASRDNGDADDYDEHLADAMAGPDNDYQWAEVTFSVTDDMNRVLTAAIDKAKRLADTDNDGVALAYICADFLGVPDESLV